MHSLYHAVSTNQLLHIQWMQPHQVLKKSQSRNVVVYTFDGAVPVISIYLTCDSEFLCWLDGRIHADVMALEECNTSYRNNYSVCRQVRSFYGGIPDFLQVGEHQFVARKLVEMWVNMMLVRW